MHTLLELSAKNHIVDALGIALDQGIARDRYLLINHFTWTLYLIQGAFVHLLFQATW